MQKDTSIDIDFTLIEINEQCVERSSLCHMVLATFIDNANFNNSDRIIPFRVGALMQQKTFVTRSKF